MIKLTLLTGFVGVNLLASASRDRLLHIFAKDQQYGVVQTLDDHSAAVTAIRFSQLGNEPLNMLSCGTDKSLLFRTAQQVKMYWKKWF